jgi:hypothetical protein
MIPSTAPPFAMTRWVAQTRQNYVSVVPYNYTDASIHGFIGTHQPAIWMGESALVVVVPGAGKVKDRFEERGMGFSHEKEVVSASYYSVELEPIEGGTILAEQSASTTVHTPSGTLLIIMNCSIPCWSRPVYLLQHSYTIYPCPSYPSFRHRILRPFQHHFPLRYTLHRPFHSRNHRT